MKQLPPSWGNPTLLECSQFVRGVTYTKSDAVDQTASGLLPIIRANNIQARRFELNDLVYVPANLVSAEQVLKAGDVVIATSSGSISVVGKAAQVRKEHPMSFGAFCGVLRPSPVIHARYFGHFFSSKAYRDAVSDLARGVNINNLKRDHFQAIRIPLAPLAEQERIADKLDTVRASVDTVNTRLARVAPLLKRFRQSVLAAATSGRMPLDQEGENRYADWPNVQLGGICSKVTDGEHATPKRATSGKYLLSARNVRDGSIALENVDFVDQTEFDRLRLRCDPSIGDVLLSCSGSVGRVALVDRDDAYVMVRSAALIRPDREKLIPKFLMYALQSPQLQQQILEASRSTAQANIFLGPIKQLTIALPSLVEQAEIVSRIETLFAFADRLEARLQAAQTAADRLTPSLLAKAFRGELVPQDPNDEPASELLKRLASQEPKSNNKRPGRKVKNT